MSRQIDVFAALTPSKEDQKQQNYPSHHSKALQAYINARAKADQEFNNVLSGFRAKQALDPSYQFRQHLEDYGDKYRDAWNERDEAASKLDSTDLLRSMQIFDHAQARAEVIEGFVSIQTLLAFRINSNYRAHKVDPHTSFVDKQCGQR